MNRNDPDEKAIIDYVIKQKKNDARIIENIVHESGALKIKSSKETDHNTMISYQCPIGNKQSCTERIAT